MKVLVQVSYEIYIFIDDRAFEKAYQHTNTVRYWSGYGDPTGFVRSLLLDRDAV